MGWSMLQKSRPAVLQKLPHGPLLPGAVAHLHGQGEIGEGGLELHQIGAVFFGVVEGIGELGQEHA